MSTAAFITAAALAAAVFSISAHAQTGRPASVEVLSDAETPHVAANDPELGSYARYLLLNGATRDQAVAAARNIDHPAPAPRWVASKTAPPAAMRSSASQ